MRPPDRVVFDVSADRATTPPFAPPSDTVPTTTGSEHVSGVAPLHEPPAASARERARRLPPSPWTLGSALILTAGVLLGAVSAATTLALVTTWDATPSPDRAVDGPVAARLVEAADDGSGSGSWRLAVLGTPDDVVVVVTVRVLPLQAAVAGGPDHTRMPHPALGCPSSIGPQLMPSYC